ncbi:PhzF family phenazine biosynthesis protein [Corynebacterium sp. H128]|uniref:PhzF family phenazine biosynthesis protein n=1 Tax=Corynebacterium sp. H128 TaxID=3133427 RepID=UPI0030B632AF
MPTPFRIRVFVDELGRYGSPLLVIMNSASLSDAECQSIARESGTSETVYVDDTKDGSLRIFVPAGRIPFAGYPLIGAGWLLRNLGYPLDTLNTDAGSVPIEVTEDACAISTAPGRGLPWKLIPTASIVELMRLSAAGENRHDYAWAWADEATGHVRARAFTSASGALEDEATGSAAIELCAVLGRELTIAQGSGSLIHVEPTGSVVRLSGRVIRER